MTICTRCYLDKGEDFRPHRTVCRECDNEMAREYNKKLKNKEKPEFIICKKCGQKKTDFVINNRICSDCKRAYGREYRRTTDKAKIWTENNKEKMSELQHDWYEKNKKAICEKRKTRLKNEPNIKLAENHRAGIRALLKQTSEQSEFVDCKSDRLRNWFQFQFSEEMSWENYGIEWTVDHVIPIDKFLKGETPQEIIFHWLNFRPASKKKNLTKNKYMCQEECQEHLENVKNYIKIRKIRVYNPDYLQELEDICDNFAKHQVAGITLGSSDTTLSEKSDEGSRLIAEPDGNNSEELDNPQAKI